MISTSWYVLLGYIAAISSSMWPSDAEKLQVCDVDEAFVLTGVTVSLDADQS